MVDAYQDITIPFQMSSREFFSLVKDHLKEDGVMVVNMNMKGSGEDSINAYLADTIADVFPAVYTVDVPYTTNRELFAAADENCLKRLDSGLVKEGQKDLRSMMLQVRSGLAPYEAGDHIMTDDKAPVELLGMRVIDEIIRDEVAYYRDIYEEEGFKGLLNYL